MMLPLLLLSVPSDVVFEEQTLPRDVRRVLPVLVVVQLLPRFAPRLRLRVVRRLLCESSDQTNQTAAGTIFNPSPRSCYPEQRLPHFLFLSHLSVAALSLSCEVSLLLCFALLFAPPSGLFFFLLSFSALLLLSLRSLHRPVCSGGAGLAGCCWSFLVAVLLCFLFLLHSLRRTQF